MTRAKVFDFGDAEWERRIYLYEFWLRVHPFSFVPFAIYYEHVNDFRCISLTVLNFKIEYITCLWDQRKVLQDQAAVGR